MLGRLQKILLIVLVLLLSFAWGCSKKPAKKVELPSEKIGVVLSMVEKDMAEEMRKVMQAESRREKVRLIWLGPAKDEEELRTNLQKLAQQKVDAAVVQFDVATSPQELVRPLVEKGIAVVAIGSLPRDTPLDAFITADGFRIGQLQGQFVKQSMQGANLFGPVLLLHGKQDNYLVQQMMEGTKQALVDLGPNVLQPLEAAPEKEDQALNKVTTTLATGGAVAVIVQGSELAARVAEKGDQIGKEARVVTVGVGGGKKAAQLMAQGKHDAEVDIQPDLIGREAFTAALELAKKGQWDYDTHVSNGNYDVSAKITPVRLITKENVYLLEQRWGKLKKEKEKGGSGDSEKQGSSSSQGQEKNPEGQASQGKMKVKLKTKDGQELEIDLPGELEKIEIESQEKPKQEGGGQNKGQ